MRRAVRRIAATVRLGLAIPDDPAALEAHRRTVLVRARAGAWIAVVVVPVTIATYFGLVAPADLTTPLAVAAAAVAGFLLVLAALGRGAFHRRYELPFFLVAGLCHVTESTVVQLSGGGAASELLFPYLLVLFGVAVLFPARAGWVLALTMTAPATYAAGELLARGAIADGRPLAQLLFLIDAAFIALIANRVTTRIFFREVEGRLALEAAHRELQALDRAKSEFFANISHDLRNPLAVITGPLSALLESDAARPPREMHLLRLATTGADRLDALITDLLELAQLDAGVTALHRANVEVRSLIGELVEQARPHADGLDVTLRFTPPARAVYAEIDVGKIERVLMNLIGNAVKYSHAGSTVDLDLSEDDARLVIRVEDRGRGIEPDDLEHIFLRFHRGTGRAQREVDGSGLGLAVARELVELHGGTIGVTSQPGVGSVFTVSLPRGG